MRKYRILEYGSFLFFVVGALLFLFQYTYLGTSILIGAIILRSIYVFKMKGVKDSKEEYKDIIDSNIEDE